MAGDNYDRYLSELSEADEPDVELGLMDDMLGAIGYRLNVWRSEADDDDVEEEAKAKITVAEDKLTELVTAIHALYGE